MNFVLLNQGNLGSHELRITDHEFRIPLFLNIHDLTAVAGVGVSRFGWDAARVEGELAAFDAEAEGRRVPAEWTGG